MKNLKTCVLALSISLLATACNSTETTKGNETNFFAQHDSQECPQNLSGQYETEINGVNARVEISFEKNQSGDYELVYGYEAQAYIIDGKEHSYKYENENGQEVQANYKGRCLDNNIDLALEAGNTSISSSFTIPSEDSVRVETNITVDGQSYKEVEFLKKK